MATVYIVIQNAIGVVAARAMDLHPVVGLLGGSITLTGGHGTGGAYATRFGETMNLQGAMELTMACATAGLVLGGLLGGPLAEFLIRRHHLSGPAEADTEAAPTTDDTPEDSVTSASFLNALFVILLCLAGGRFLARVMEGTGIILPDFLFCLLLGVVVRNVLPLTPRFRLSEASVDLLGSIALSLFLVMALMAMKLLDLVNLAGPRAAARHHPASESAPAAPVADGTSGFAAPPALRPATAPAPLSRCPRTSRRPRPALLHAAY